MIKLNILRVGRMALRKNDDVEMVVRNFVKIWGLSSNDLEKLREQAYKEMIKLK